MNIRQQAAYAVANLSRAEARGEELSVDRIEDAIREHLKHARRARREHPAAVIVTTLCDSHRGAKHTDYVRIEGARAADLKITIKRKPPVARRE